MMKYIGLVLGFAVVGLAFYENNLLAVMGWAWGCFMFFMWQLSSEGWEESLEARREALDTFEKAMGERFEVKK